MTTTLSRPSPLSSSSSDPYLSARLTNARRSEKVRRPSQVSTPTLDAVPEDGSQLKKLPPSSYRSISESGLLQSKGKARATSNGRESSDPRERNRTDWIVDLTETARGAEKWEDRERVILIVGSEFTLPSPHGMVLTRSDPTADVLAPILYNPSFSNTLLLVGTIDPSPSIESLTSPSHLLHSASTSTIYPTIQPFNLSDRDTIAHTVPAIIEMATTMAAQYRKSALRTPRPPVRRDSSDSAASSTPPRTPPMSVRLSPDALDAQIRRVSSDFPYEHKRSQSLGEPFRQDAKTPSQSPRPRPRSKVSSLNLSRESVFGGLSNRSKSDQRVTIGGSPFDAVINFIPAASDFAPQRAMQEMLHQSVVLTTGVMPLLTRRSVKGTSPNSLPISVVHILPSQVPGPLPGVVENFILGLLPKFMSQSERELWSSVTTIPAWLAAPRQLGNESYSGAEVFLFGGLRCPESSEAGTKSRAFLPNWKVCTLSPGTIASYRPSRPAAVSQLSDPLSIAYTDVEARGLPNQANKPLPALYPDNSRQIFRGDMPLHLGGMEPSTPDLDPSTSSCSSSSHVGEVNSTGSEEAYGKAAQSEFGKKKGGFARWFKKSRS